MEEKEKPKVKLGKTGKPCPHCVKHTDFVTLDAKKSYQFYGQVHDVARDSPMWFFVNVIA
jgi:hypothetical protein